MSAASDGDAIRAALAARVDALEARERELVAALRDAVLCARMWHDPECDRKEYRFDLSDHPKMRRAVAALASAKGPA